MAKSERALLLAATLDLLVADIGVVHAVNELHVVMAGSPQSQGYEVSGSIVVSVSSGTMHVTGTESNTDTEVVGILEYGGGVTTIIPALAVLSTTVCIR